MHNLSLTIVSDLSKDIKGVMALIYSFFENGNSNSKIVNLITDIDISDPKVIEVDKFTNSLGLQLNHIDIKKEKDYMKVLESKREQKNYNSLSHISNMAYSKILIFKLIKEKTIYMDTDTLIVRKMNLPKMTLINRKILFVKNGEHSPGYWLKRYEGIYKDKNEVIKNAFNSGVFIKNFIDANYGIEQYNKLINSIKENNFTYLDQAHFNYVFKNHKGFLPLKYNFPIHNLKNRIVKKESNPIILHFASKNKPWLNSKESKYHEIWQIYWMKAKEKINIWDNFINE